MSRKVFVFKLKIVVGVLVSLLVVLVGRLGVPCRKANCRRSLKRQDYFAFLNWPDSRSGPCLEDQNRQDFCASCKRKAGRWDAVVAAEKKTLHEIHRGTPISLLQSGRKKHPDA